MRTFVGQSHPNIFKFIEAIKNEQNLQEMKMAQISASQEPAPKRKKYENLNKRLQNIVTHYNRDNILEYLKRIAHNVVF